MGNRHADFTRHDRWSRSSCSFFIYLSKENKTSIIQRRTLDRRHTTNVVLQLSTPTVVDFRTKPMIDEKNKEDRTRFLFSGRRWTRNDHSGRHKTTGKVQPFSNSLTRANDPWKSSTKFNCAKRSYAENSSCKSNETFSRKSRIFLVFHWPVYLDNKSNRTWNYWRRTNLVE